MILSSEKRKADRLSLSIPVFYSLAPEEDLWFSPIAVEDISGNGIRLLLKQHLKKNTYLWLKIDLTDGHPPILVRSCVTWSKRTSSPYNKGYAYSTGISFGKMSYEERRHFVQFICSNILLNYAKQLTQSEA